MVTKPIGIATTPRDATKEAIFEFYTRGGEQI